MRAVLTGKTYVAVNFKDEAEFESICVRKANRIFWSWDDSGTPIYVDMKPRISSKAGTLTIPDGYLLRLNENPASSCFYFVEYEISGHPVYEHIVPQIMKFQMSLSNPATRDLLADAFHPLLERALRDRRFKKAYGHRYPHDVLRGLLSNQNNTGVIVVIDEITDQLLQTKEHVERLVDQYWMIEVNALVEMRARTSPRAGTKVFGRYPVDDEDGSPRWYSATLKRKAGEKSVVQWTDGDRTNTRVDQVVPFERHVLTVRVHE